MLEVWANKIGPYNSPTESYGFFDALAWCKPEKLERRSLGLGEALAGDFLVKSMYQLSFNQSQKDVSLCEIALSGDDVDKFIAAIKQRYVYELLLDNLPLKLFVGETKGEKAYIYTHLDFAVYTNSDNVVQASANPVSPVELVPGKETSVRFTYSTEWKTVRYRVSCFMHSYPLTLISDFVFRFCFSCCPSD